MKPRDYVLPGFIALGIMVMGFFLLFLSYVRTDDRMFTVLTADHDLATVTKLLGKPSSIIPAGEKLQMMGWPLPKIDRGHEIWIYYTHTGRGFFVSVDRSKDRVEYVFSSSS